MVIFGPVTHRTRTIMFLNQGCSFDCLPIILEVGRSVVAVW
jgi:hypothetical protein